MYLVWLESSFQALSIGVSGNKVTLGEDGYDFTNKCKLFLINIISNKNCTKCVNSFYMTMNQIVQLIM